MVASQSSISDRVLALVVEHKRITYAEICACLPYVKASISWALRRLNDSGLVIYLHDARGPHWRATTKGARAVREAPTKSA